jgi:hypothetical protein
MWAAIISLSGYLVLIWVDKPSKTGVCERPCHWPGAWLHFRNTRKFAPVSGQLLGAFFGSPGPQSPCKPHH